MNTLVARPMPIAEPDLSYCEDGALLGARRLACGKRGTSFIASRRGGRGGCTCFGLPRVGCREAGTGSNSQRMGYCRVGIRSSQWMEPDKLQSGSDSRQQCWLGLPRRSDKPGRPLQESVSWPGVARPPTTLKQPNRQIVPIWISRDNQAHFPGSVPSLDVGFSLNGGRHIAMLLGIDQTMQAISGCEHRPSPVFMRADPGCQIAGHAGVQRSIWTVRHDVDPTNRHGSSLSYKQLTNRLGGRDFLLPMIGQRHQVVGGRATPGHDTKQRPTRPWTTDNGSTAAGATLPNRHCATSSRRNWHRMGVPNQPRMDIRNRYRTDVSNHHKIDFRNQHRTNALSHHRTDVSNQRRTDVHNHHRTHVINSSTIGRHRATSPDQRTTQ